MGVTTVEGAEVGVETFDLRREVMRSFTVGVASLSIEERLEKMPLGC